MSSNVKSKSVVVFGVGEMGREYVRVLEALSVSNVVVVGRSAEGCELFEKATGKKAVPGGAEDWLEHMYEEVEYAIVAVSVESLAEVATLAIAKGIKKILLEKPGGLNSGEVRRVAKAASSMNARVVLGYNRRFYASTRRAVEMIGEDGGVSSFHFEFTEWPHTVLPLNHISEATKRNWFLANSTHVADLAFFLGGWPKELTAFRSGGACWHPSATVFAGAGVSNIGAVFSYKADWESPGRWGVEVMTRRHRLILRPLERLFVQKQRSLDVALVEGVDYGLDEQFKPGLYLQTKAFLEGLEGDFIDIHSQLRAMEDVYSKIAGY